jgi:hypothetical protein
MPVLKAIRVLTLLVAAVSLVNAQFGGGGGGGQGGGGGGGIPLGGAGHSDDEGNKADKPNPAERPVTGVVTDADGKPVIGALVQLTNKQTTKVLSVITSDKGEYRFSGLKKESDYQLKATFKDHASAAHTLSQYDPRPKPVVNLQLQ